jgi:hypothetical protein
VRAKKPWTFEKRGRQSHLGAQLARLFEHVQRFTRWILRRALHVDMCILLSLARCCPQLLKQILVVDSLNMFSNTCQNATGCLGAHLEHVLGVPRKSRGLYNGPWQVTRDCSAHVL